jgi:hypothetical protein
VDKPGSLALARIVPANGCSPSIFLQTKPDQRHSLQVRIKPRIHCFIGLSLGLLASRAGADDASSLRVAVPEQAAKSRTVDLRPTFEKWGLKPRSQGSRPTCSVFTFTGALEFAVANAQQRGERLSAEFLNWAANQTGRRARDGGFFSEMWDGFASHGICTEQKMPYQTAFDPARSPAPTAQTEAKETLSFGLQQHWIKQWNVNTGLSPAEFAGIKKTLEAGWPVCGGFRWPKEERWKEDVLQMCPPQDVFDGHSVLLVGYREEAGQPGGGVLIFRNTGRGGRDGYMPYAYAQAFMNDAVWIESKVQAALRQPNSR